ncbi:hypothetical protein [Enterococcus sp. LJL51]|uniref:hypothetical protein n=1 Tax=Enterococcus sp. LJL51 TaxID=3416656 RepID=UPI003CF53D3D
MVGCVPFCELKKQVKFGVFQKIKNVDSNVEFHVFESVYERSDVVDFMRRDTFLNYQEGEVPASRFDFLKETWVSQLYPQLKLELRL